MGIVVQDTIVKVTCPYGAVSLPEIPTLITGKNVVPFLWSPPVLPMRDALRAVWTEGYQLAFTKEAFIQDQVRWIPDESFGAEISLKTGYRGILMRTKSDLTEDELGEFGSHLLNHLQSFGLRPDRIPAVTASLSEFVKGRCEAAQELGLSKHAIRVSCTVGDVGPESRWHSDIMNVSAPN